MSRTSRAAQESADHNSLLERDEQLAALGVLVSPVIERGRGRMVIVGGEAGVGKTALVRRFCREHTGAMRVLTGSCDPLTTPRPLGPFLDIAPFVSRDFQALAYRGQRPYEIADALMRALAQGPSAILHIEDVHWADAATLDVLHFLARRIESLPILVVMTYRDELERAHPLRILLGNLPSGDTIARLRLAPLSPEAVARLAEPRGVNGDDLYRKTAGNPFFVTEVLAAGDVAIPPTVRDAVLARVARLSPAAASLLDAVSIVPLQTELWLLGQLVGSALDDLDACLNSGILAATPAAVGFRHELARLAIEDTLSPVRRMTLHQQALRALESPPTGEPDLARLVHHAESAADDAAILRWAPAAGARAASLGAHREAAAHYARTLRFAGGLGPLERGEWFARHANESYLADQFPITLTSGWQAVECFRSAGAVEREGLALCEVSSHARCLGSADEAEAVGWRAVTLLEQAPPGRELAMAYANIASLRLNADDVAAATEFAQRAHSLAQSLGDTEAELHALNTLGTIGVLTGAAEGMAKFQASLELALAAGMEEHVGRVYVNHGWMATRTRSYAGYDRWFRAGSDYCNQHGLVLWMHYILGYASRWALDQGRWSDAIDLAQQVWRDPRTTLPTIFPLLTTALIRARRGDPQVWPLLDQALALAEPTGELQHLAPVAAARAEAAWLEGRPAAVDEATAAVLVKATQSGALWLVGELACWRWRAGLDASATGAAEPYAREIEGRWAEAARFWDARSCSYDAALARASSHDEGALRDALANLQRLGAHATARVVARRLRALGVRDLPRGPRASTQANEAHLTARELNVLDLVTQGLNNTDIATSLYLSPKTVERHISAIFAKLGVRTRAEAMAQARNRHLIPLSR